LKGFDADSQVVKTTSRKFSNQIFSIDVHQQDVDRYSADFGDIRLESLNNFVFVREPRLGERIEVKLQRFALDHMLGIAGNDYAQHRSTGTTFIPQPAELITIPDILPHKGKVIRIEPYGVALIGANNAL
jgi:hypothetical protein